MSVMQSNRATSIKLSDLANLDNPILSDDVDLDFDSDNWKHLSPEIRETLTREKVRRAIRDYGKDGLSIEEIVALTNLNRIAIKKHLDKLSGLREVYSQKKNYKITLYYHKGKPLHHLGKRRLDCKDTIIESTIAQGKNDSIFFHILEKRYSVLEGETPEGAIMIPIEQLERFIENLKELKENYGGLSYGAKTISNT
jgi:predicted DNA-binding protein YlxM (UPF0122 family)